ncbi:carbohydrate ABC transporter permease [Clostridium felsineum]|uniref:carbohydrate ABC transporter permease n=1 Tax=Clostridium felsineum TaxID=36839 RepID=UPI00098C1330|nr:carbohydrate ABC transporter permease [Clostridium felsineum]URZ17651.1 Lactose transport system permease protein LacG [Clostridium felsineum DSM 794]
MNKKNKTLIFFEYVVLSIFAIGAIFPVIYMVSNSLMGESEVTSALQNFKFHIIPDGFTLIQYYNSLLKQPDFLLKFWNSVILTVPTVIGQIVVSIFGAYSFAKIKFKYKTQIFFMFIILMIMPYQVTLVPIYIIMKKLNLVGSYASVILPGIFSTFGVFLMTQFMKSIPDEQCQAAKIDGANDIQILFKIVLPQCKGALVSLMILSFIDNWNMIEQPLILLQDKKQPLSTFLSQINTGELGIAFACGVIFMIPSILMFLKGEDELLKGIQHLDMK